MVFTKLACLAILEISGIFAFEVLVSPTDPAVRENDSVTLTCSLSGSGTVEAYTWSLFARGTESKRPVGVLTKDCIAPIDPVNSTLYSYSCPDDRHMTWTIKRVETKNKGDKYQCTIALDDKRSNFNFSTLNLKIPVTSVTVNLPLPNEITLPENTSTSFQCVTSESFPEATVKWFKDPQSPTDTNDDIEITAFASSSSTVTTDQLKITKSNLTFSPVRTDNNMSVFCSANNGDSDVLSSRKLLIVHYPPNGGPVIQEGPTFSVIQNISNQLSCSITGGNPLPLLFWSCYQGQITDSSEGNNVTKVVSWAASRGEDRTCVCNSSYNSGYKSASINITVLYPPSSPTFLIGGTGVSSTIKAIRGNRLSVVCVSSGKPNPGYTWQYNNGTKVNSSQLDISNIQISSNGNFTCEVENTMLPSRGSPVSTSQKTSVTVQVLYPPTIQGFRYDSTDGSPISQRTLNVIRGDSFKIACISDGNPSPNYTWNIQTGMSNILKITEIAGNLTATCSVKNTMTETVGQTKPGIDSLDLHIEEFYPPTTPVLQYRPTLGSFVNISNILSVIENRTFSVTCVSDSRPFPSYSWGTAGSAGSSTLIFTNIQRSRTGVYMCDVANTMTRSFANPELVVSGRNQSSFTMDVNYAPTVKDLPNLNIVEGVRLSVTCQVISSNPPVSKYQWTRQRDDKTVWENQILEIPNVKKTDAANYTCTVYNTMKPTAEIEVDGQDFKSFFLNVWYNSTITSFTLNGTAGDIVVKENDTDLQVTCLVDSNPESYIFLQHNNRTLSSGTGVKFLSSTIGEAKCTDAGRYTCVGYNQYNLRNSSKDLNLSVKCSPRPSPFFDLKGNVTSALHRPCTMQFTALAYPQPKTSEYSWFKYENLQWSPIQNNTDAVISTSGLDTRLTVLNVTESSFGTYNLTVRNEVGSWEQLFYLNAEDVPNTPTGFVNLEDQATDTSLSFQWYPGFNGGPQQTFVLQYKKTYDQNWTSINISHADESTLIYTIKPLISDTQYDVKLFAINRIGSSRSSLTITVSTKKSETPDPTNPPGALIGGAVGGVFGFGIVIIIVVVVFIRRRSTRKGTEASQLALHKTGRQQTEEDSSDEDVMVENKMYESAGQIIAKDEPLYNKPSKKVKVDAKNADVYAVVDKSKKKENQKKKKEKQQQIKHQGDIYENAPEKSPAGNNTYGNAAFEDNPYENPERSRPSLTPKKHVNQDGLIYADLAFNDQPKGQKKLVIHGLDEMTTYVQVDFNKKADPLPDSDTEEQSENKKK